MKREITIFDKEEIYHKDIEKKVMELRQLCNMCKLPMFVTVCVKNTKKGTEYKSEMVGAFSNGIQLTDDRIPDHINVMNGFTTVMKTDETEVEIEL